MCVTYRQVTTGGFSHLRFSAMRKRLLALALLLAWPARPDAAVAHNPIVVFDNVNGTDTGASGSPADLTAIFAAATCHTNGASSTTIQWAANGFLAASVPTGFKAAVWIKAAAGRQWSEINTYATNTVTVEDNFNIAAGSPVDCAVGGLRRTIAGSVQLFTDMKGVHSGSQLGWFIRFTNTGTNYTTGATITLNNGESSEFAGVSGYPTIEMTANSTLLTPNNCNVHGLTFINSNATKGSATGINRGGSNFNQIYDNVIGGSTAALSFNAAITGGTATPNDGTIWGNEIKNNVTGITITGQVAKILWNYIHNNTTGISSTGGNGFIWRNLVVNNTGDGINTSAGGTHWIIENTIDGNGGDGIDFGGNATYMSVVNNQITNNTLFGITCTAATVGCNTTREDRGLVSWNNFFTNGSGDRNNFLTGESETAVNPGYINRAGGNYCIPDNANNRGGPPGPPPAVYRGSLTQSLILKGACQPIGGGAANLGI